MGEAEAPEPTMGLRPKTPSALARFFAFVIARRWLVVAFYALVLPPSALYAMKVGQDNDIQRLIIPTDPDFINTKEFQKVFGAGEYAVLLAEADDPFDPAVLDRVDKIERAVAEIPRVSVNSALSIYRRARAGFTATPAESAAFAKFVNGTSITRKQGLTGDHFLAISVVLDVQSNEDRGVMLAAIDKAIAAAGGGGPPLLKLRRVGQPYVNAYLDDATREGGKYFGLFAVFVVVLNVLLYRSARTLVAFLVTLGVCMATSVGYIGLSGGTFTIVSPMVPMTILVTATATLVYLQSRFVDRPAERPVDEHQIFSLCNKFVACTASIFATLVGFAALAVSEIRPVRQMGLWVAVGLFLSWIIVFTLFPALQKILRTPTSQEKAVAGAWFVQFTHWLPRASYRARYALVGAALVLMAAGGVALFGLPGTVDPMRILVDPVEYVNHGTDLYADTKFVQKTLPGLSITEVWLKGKLGCISEPKALAGLARFQTALEADPDIGAVVSPITILEMIRYLGGQGDAFPTDPDGVDQVAADLEALAPHEPMLGRFVQANGLGQAHLAVVTRVTEHEAFQRLSARIGHLWDAGGEAHARAPGHRAEDGGARPAPGEDEPEPGAHAGGELRAHRGHHLHDVRRGLPQRRGAPHDDDPLALRHPGDVRGDAARRDAPQRGHHPHRLHRAGHQRERSDPLLLPLPREAEGGHGRGGAPPHAARVGQGHLLRHPHQRRRLHGLRALAAPADLPVR